ncbi:MAG: hypothetical protein UT08_C0007G0033 [Candidatus Woesebacteria bacterium GW2011_GWB1_38_8]|uniref:Uncharacterized protein n=1 Tax=Candidatus Woesebacteria bacterium GW2011_GWB1_38_8 TaxID=1618570 RepID=A0A0G0LBW9_9BACT|nr:MAG: hypothetical protein UT08_C0007G0033 [Candidatus Woesebacteria bacterium GW2011_GWB1_38_8]
MPIPIEALLMMSPIQADVQKALSRPSDIPGDIAPRRDSQRPFSGHNGISSSISPQGFGNLRFVSPDNLRERGARLPRNNRVVKSGIGTFVDRGDSGLDFDVQVDAFTGFLDRLGINSDELQTNLDSIHSYEEKQTALLNHTYLVLGTEVGRNSFIDGLQKLNRPTLERVSDLKANAFDELGMGLARNVIAERQLGKVTRSLVKDINQVANSRLFDGASVQQQINEIIASYQEKHDIDPKTLVNLGLVVATAVGAAAAYKGRKYLPAALIVLGSVLSACQPPGQQANPAPVLATEVFNGGSEEDYSKVLTVTADMANEAAKDWLDVYIETEDPNDPQKVYIFDVESIDWVEREGSNELSVFHPNESEGWVTGEARVRTSDGISILPIIQIHHNRENNEIETLGLSLDDENSTQEQSLYRAIKLEGEVIIPTQDNLVTRNKKVVNPKTGKEEWVVAGFAFRDVNAVITDDSQPTQSPTDVPLGWEDFLVGFDPGQDQRIVGDAPPPTEVQSTQAPIPTLEPSPTPTLVSGPTLTVESTLENENLDSIEEAAQKMNDFLDGGLELSLMNEEDWLVDEKGDKVGFGWSRITAINWKDFGADEIMLHFGPQVITVYRNEGRQFIGVGYINTNGKLKVAVISTGFPNLEKSNVFDKLTTAVFEKTNVIDYQNGGVGSGRLVQDDIAERFRREYGKQIIIRVGASVITSSDLWNNSVLNETDRQIYEEHFMPELLTPLFKDLSSELAYFLLNNSDNNQAAGVLNTLPNDRLISNYIFGNKVTAEQLRELKLVPISRGWVRFDPKPGN